MAKKAKHEGFLDRLPDSILCRILSFLPTKDAVRTSILSPRWRYLFTSSISTLDFSDCLGHSPPPREHINNFKKFVDMLFLNPKHLILECFRVSDLWVNDRSGDGFLSIYNWLCAALWRGVKEIDVLLCRGDLRMLPTLLFTCPSLVTLKLYVYNSGMKVPTNLSLPNLRTLHLSNMKFVDGCSFYRLISGCHVLEDLDISRCLPIGTSELNIHSLSLKRLTLDFRNFRDECRTEIVIDAPGLVNFQYTGPVEKGYTLRNMECLEKADIELFHFGDADRDRSATLLWGICNVQSLCLTIHDYDESLLRMPLDSVLIFHNLVDLKFTNPRGDWKGTWIVEFLHCVPNLITLTLDLEDADKGFKPLPEDVPSCLLYSLENIYIHSFMGDTHVFELVGYFLNHSLVLELLVIYARGGRSSIIGKLWSLPKISKECEVVILGR